MLKLLLLALPIIPVALAHVPAPEHPGTAGAAGPVRCEIEESTMPGGVELRGFVVSTQPVSGSYAFNVEKRGAAGVSNSTQSGDFKVAAEQQEEIGQVGLGLERGASYKAELTISWPGGQVSCVKRHPDRI